MRPPHPESLSAEELDAFRRLGADLRRILLRARRIAARLQAARRRSRRALVRDRLLCVVQDSIAPAVRDVESIETAADIEEGRMELTSASQDVRDEIDRMREALRVELAKSFRSHAEVEREVRLGTGELGAILSGETELEVAHLFRILRAIGVPPRRFFAELAATSHAA